MDIQNARSIHQLVTELNDLQNQYDRVEFFRDHYKYCTIKVETVAPRSGHYYLDVDDFTVKELFTKKMNDIAREIGEINQRILELTVNVPDDVKS